MREMEAYQKTDTYKMFKQQQEKRMKGTDLQIKWGGEGVIKIIQR